METKKFFIKKKLGQHFLKNENILKKIVNISNLRNKNIIEIGPGQGSLTKYIIAEKPKSLLLIEKDKSLEPFLDKLVKINEPKISVIYGDILDTNLLDFSKDKKSVIIGNLPYNISITLILNLIRLMNNFACMIFMVQSEVADRLSAEVSSKRYGRVSIICQLFCNVEKIFEIGPGNFFPKPKVNSTLIKITPRNRVLFEYENFNIMLKKAFCYRRKKIKNNLLRHFPKLGEKKIQVRINLDKRPQDFSPEEYLDIFKLLFNN